MTANGDLPPWASRIAVLILGAAVMTALGFVINVMAGQATTLTDHEARLTAAEAREEMVLETLRDLKEANKDVVQRLDTLVQRLPGRGGR